jgi:general secretion pathway protein M
VSWLETRSPRERALLLVGLPVVFLAAGYQAVWAPLTEARSAAHEEISAYRTITSAVDAARDRPQTARPAVADARPIATRVTASAQDASVSLRRLEPEGEALRVTIDDTAFTDIVTWLSALESEASVRIISMEMDRRPEPGVVATRLTLGEAR